MSRPRRYFLTTEAEQLSATDPFGVGLTATRAGWR